MTSAEMHKAVSTGKIEASIQEERNISAMENDSSKDEGNFITNYILKVCTFLTFILYQRLYTIKELTCIRISSISNEMSMSLFRFIAVVGRTQLMANTLGTATLVAIYILGGFVISKDDIQPWLVWAYWLSPMTYGQNAVAINEFLDQRWNMKTVNGESTGDTVGKTILRSRGMLTEWHWFWYSVMILLLFVLVFNILSIFALEYLRGLYIFLHPTIKFILLAFGADLMYILFSPVSQMFINEVMELVELKSLKNAMVGLPGVSGLAAEERKRLTIAVELVSSPSIIFMDEPTTGLDARAAAIVMRTVRKAADTGRTIVCTIHQPSIEIFEAFDEVIQ
ncbi:hypothetical protein BHE74_00017806 [Ensete ventricosum]|nr:hypothetical protein GW17_00001445 [Ensete ventricosum]RWW74263.1 hypothetical protein BHE74_00017806 [Ensete ventricosum]RZR96972.1 hypothetical protein BHM03_00026071 [Ensete ventricosum]